MAKKKNSMALFEVISKSRDKNPDAEVLVPGWVKGQKEPEAPAPPVEEPAPQQTEEVEPVETPSAVVQPPPAEPVAPEPEPQPEPEQTFEPEPQAPETMEAPEPPMFQPPTEPEPSPYSAQTEQTADDKPAETPIWSTDGARLTISLNYVSCLVASIGILFLIIGAFVLGRATAPSETIATPTSQATIKRQPGKYYMVIERFAGNGPEVRAEAKRVAEFCNANGEPAQVQLIPRVVNGKIVRGQGNLIVWSATAFDSPQSEEVSGHALFIQNELGAKYAKKYGSRYRFLQPQRNGKIAPTMYPYKKRR